jgi:Fe-S-cluster containining protein
MDSRSEKILKDYENNMIGMDDAFQFRCRACGKCCKNRHDILLSARDLFHIARTLGRTMEYVVKRYCNTYLGDSSRVPIVRLNSVGPDQACPLLWNKRCIVHKAKPLVCALYPLGRGVTMERDDNDVSIPEEIKFDYFLQSNICGSKETTHTVRAWLTAFDIPIDDEFSPLWIKTTSMLSSVFKKLEASGYPVSELNAFANAAFILLYLQYDTEKDLLPQFQKNAELLTGGLQPFLDKVALKDGGGTDGE